MGFLSRVRAGDVRALTGDPRGDTVLALCARGRVDSWDPARGASSLLADDALAVAVRDDGNEVFVLAEGGGALRRHRRCMRFGNHSMYDRMARRPIDPPVAGRPVVATRHAGRVVVAQYVAADGVIRVGVVDGALEPARDLAVQASPHLLAISADATVVVATFDRAADQPADTPDWRAWRVSDGTEIGDGRCGGPITAIGVERTGAEATVGAACGGNVHVWRQVDVDAPSPGRVKGTFRFPSGPVTGLHLAVGDGPVTTSAPDGTLRRWHRSPSGFQLSDTMTRRRFAPTALALGVLALWWVLQAIGDVLKDLHLPGSLGAYSIPDILSLSTTPGTAAERLGVWADWDASRAITGQRLTSGLVATTWLVVDVVFAVALGVLATLVISSRRRVRSFESGDYAKAVCALLAVARWATVIYVGAELVENVALGVAVHFGPDAPVPLWIAYVVGLVKWAAIAYVALTVLISFLGIDKRQPGYAVVHSTSPRVWQTVLEVRAEAVAVGIITAALLFLPANVRPQLHDVVRDWRRDWGELVAAAIAVVVLSLAVLVLGARGLQRAWAYRSETVTGGHLPATGWRTMVIVGLASLALTGLGYLVLDAWLGEGWFAVVAAVIAAAYLVPLVSRTVRNVPAERPGFTPSASVLRLLAIVPCVAFVVVWIRAEVGKILEEPGRIVVLLFMLVGLGVVAVAVYLPPIQRVGSVFGPRGSMDMTRDELSRHLHDRHRFQLPEVWTALVLFVVAAALLLLIDVGRLGRPTSIGAVAIITIWTIAVLGLLVAVNALLFKPPHGLLALLRARRFPTLLTVLLAGLLMSQLVNRPGFHRADLVDAERPELMDLDEAFDAWVTARVDGADRPWVPLVIMAASGGGGRAAYWTDLALGCMFGGGVALDEPACQTDRGPAQYEDVFAISGISGGSVGAAMYEASRAKDEQNADDVFQEGFVDPIVSNLVVRDIPNALLYATAWEDRAERLEREWEDAIPGLAEPFFRPREEGSWRPLLLLNSASVEDGCRVVAAEVAVAVDTATNPPTPRELSGSCRSLIQQRLAPPGPPDPLDGEADVDTAAQPWPATRDLGAILCPDQNVATSTAALLSARFPYISPSGAIEYCDDPDRFTYLVDGGTVDSSAAAPASLLLEAVVRLARDHNDTRDGGPCIQPVVIQVDNGYEDVLATPNGDRPSELVVPVAGGISALTNNAETARQQLAVLASQLRERAGCDTPELPRIPTYLQIFPQSHPGTEAPLGWSLSHEARADMKDQLGASANQCSLMVLRTWLTADPGDGVCLTGTVERRASGSEPGMAVAEHNVKICIGPGEPVDVPTNPYGVFVVVVEGEDVTLPDPAWEAVCSTDVALVDDPDRQGFGVTGQVWVGASFELVDDDTE